MIKSNQCIPLSVSVRSQRKCRNQGSIKGQSEATLERETGVYERENGKNERGTLSGEGEEKTIQREGKEEKKNNLARDISVPDSWLTAASVA